MSGDSYLGRPPEDRRHLSAFGVGGDYVGARRARRAFRLLVIAWVAFTVALYFVEHYLRYDLNEVQYRMALTLEDDSRRAILRNVVRRDAEEREVPTARYVEALAHIEEDDVILERYAEAVKLAPDKGALLIAYGCALFQDGQYRDARQVFREANLKTTRNALPKYLQAAALTASSSSEEDFRTAMALVGRANESGEKVLFPQPPWHESLPRSGQWYHALRQRLAGQCCAPLYHFKNAIIKRARDQAGAGEFQAWDAWLLQLQLMGDRLIGGPGSEPEHLGTNQALYGLQIKKDALAMRIAVREEAGMPPPTDLLDAQANVQGAIDRLQRFEERRRRAVDAARDRVRQPLLLVLNGFLILLAALTACALLGRLLGADKNARTLQQPPRASLAIGVWTLALLTNLAILSSTGGGFGATQVVLGATWYVLLALLLLCAAAFPCFHLPAATAVCSGLEAEPFYAKKVAEARVCRRRAYVALAGRFIHNAFGLYTIMVCIWILGYRVLAGLYPTDLKLIVSGMTDAEVALIHEIRRVIGL